MLFENWFNQTKVYRFKSSNFKLKAAALEKELEKTREQYGFPSVTSLSSITDIRTSSSNFPHKHNRQRRTLAMSIPSSPIWGESIISGDAYHETVFLPALASIAHHGEFTGRGSVICTLHSVCLIRKLAGYAIRNAEAVSWSRLGVLAGDVNWREIVEKACMVGHVHLG